MYANFLRHSHSHREAGFIFLDWISSIKKAPIPKAIVEQVDAQFLELLQGWLLVPDHRQRKTCAECLGMPYLSKARLHHSKTNPLGKTADGDEDDHHRMPAEGVRKIRHRVEDHSKTPMYSGTLWKHNQGTDPSDHASWLQRDMWVANNGSLCYFSQADMKRLVLLDSHRLHCAEISKVSGLARDPAIKIKCNLDEADDAHEFLFAADSAEEGDKWLHYLVAAAAMDMMPTMKLGEKFNEHLTIFKVAVKNRRMKVDAESHQFAPVFKGNVWKVKAAGDAMKECDWFLRQTWLSVNGSLVYFSVREDRELIYFTANDVARAQISKVSAEKSIKPFAFQVVLPPCEGMQFAPGEFAAESEELREQWIQEFTKFKA
jgi:hypothetical protein